ncbi:MAG: hypothetical protein IE889_02785 [Campylobacterales bacterium]|nr:hypothetical protein [Campylobacterales bacterium]
MKKILFLTLASIWMSQAASLSQEEINNMVEQIKKERAGINLDRLKDTPNPFAIVKAPEVEEKVGVIQPVKNEESVAYELTAILNRAAFINGKWYKAGESLGIYKVISVNKNSVTLRYGTETKVLGMPEKKKKFILFKGN